MSLEVTPLGGRFGAGISGLDLRRPPSDDQRDAIRAALDEHRVVLFRHPDGPPSPDEVVRFCSSFGPLRPTLADRSRLPGHPGINLVSNSVVDGTEGTGGNGIVEWHSDVHFEPPMIETIYLDAVEVSSTGGETSWLDLCAAFDDLDPLTRTRIEPLLLRYRFRTDLDYRGYFKASGAQDAGEEGLLPLVRRNRRTGRRSVWPTPGPDLYDVEVVGLSPADSRSLLDELLAHCTDPRYRLTHRWQPGDAAMWLNTQTLHRREAFPASQRRVLRHVNILEAA